MSVNVEYEKKKERKSETAWILETKQSPNGTKNIWKKSSDVKEIANSLDLVFAESSDEAISQIRSRYPEESGPITYLKYHHWYGSTNKESIILGKTARILENISLEDLAEYLKQYDGKLEVANIQKVAGDTYYNMPENTIEIRSKLYDAGIATNLRDNTLEYNPKKAQSLKKRMLSYYKDRRLGGCNRLNYTEIKGYVYNLERTLREAISDEIGISGYGWHIRPDWQTQLASWNVGGIIRSYALLYDRVFGKGSYRNHQSWQDLKERWKTLTPKKKEKLGDNFIKWIEAEFKKPRTRADLTKPKI